MAVPVKFPAPLNPQEMNRPLEFPAPQTFSHMTQSSCPNFLPFCFSLSQMLSGIMGRETQWELQEGLSCHVTRSLHFHIRLRRQY